MNAFVTIGSNLFFNNFAAEDNSVVIVNRDHVRIISLTGPDQLEVITAKHLIKIGANNDSNSKKLEYSEDDLFICPENAIVSLSKLSGQQALTNITLNFPKEVTQIKVKFDPSISLGGKYSVFIPLVGFYDHLLICATDHQISPKIIQSIMVSMKTLESQANKNTAGNVKILKTNTEMNTPVKNGHTHKQNKIIQQYESFNNDFDQEKSCYYSLNNNNIHKLSFKFLRKITDSTDKNDHESKLSNRSIGSNSRSFLKRNNKRDTLNASEVFAKFHELGLTYDEFEDCQRAKYQEAYRTMRGYISPCIFVQNYENLYEEYKTFQAPQKLLDHIWNRRVLWLICLHPSDLLKISADELSQLSFDELDLTEHRALWFALPYWPKSSNLVNNTWRRQFKNSLDEKVYLDMLGKLPIELQQNPVYEGIEDLVLYDYLEPLSLIRELKKRLISDTMNISTSGSVNLDQLNFSSSEYVRSSLHNTIVPAALESSNDSSVIDITNENEFENSFKSILESGEEYLIMPSPMKNPHSPAGTVFSTSSISPCKSSSLERNREESFCGRHLSTRRSRRSFGDMDGSEDSFNKDNLQYNMENNPFWKSVFQSPSNTLSTEDMENLQQQKNENETNEYGDDVYNITNFKRHVLFHGKALEVDSITTNTSDEIHDNNATNKSKYFTKLDKIHDTISPARSQLRRSTRLILKGTALQQLGSHEISDINDYEQQLMRINNINEYEMSTSFGNIDHLQSIDTNKNINNGHGKKHHRISILADENTQLDDFKIDIDGVWSTSNEETSEIKYVTHSPFHKNKDQHHYRSSDDHIANNNNLLRTQRMHTESNIPDYHQMKFDTLERNLTKVSHLLNKHESYNAENPLDFTLLKGLSFSDDKSLNNNDTYNNIPSNSNNNHQHDMDYLVKDVFKSYCELGEIQKCEEIIKKNPHIHFDEEESYELFFTFLTKWMNQFPENELKLNLFKFLHHYLNINLAQPMDGTSVLHEVINDEHIAKYCLENGGDVLARDKNGVSVLKKILEYGPSHWFHSFMKEESGREKKLLGTPDRLLEYANIKLEFSEHRYMITSNSIKN
eukprot:gene9847-13246_t